MASTTDVIRGESTTDRQRFIIDTFMTAYHDLMTRDRDAWRGKFRKMSSTAFAFYRGSAPLFYADVSEDDDPFLDHKTSRVWIQGDLHAANFGTYMNSAGVLVFDVNDYDEAYIGPFTWDLKRLSASLALLGFEKALSDDDIALMISTVVRSYAAQVGRFANKEADQSFALTLANTEGALLDVLRQARLRSRLELLERETVIDNYDRRFRIGGGTQPVDGPVRQKVLAAFERYLESIPPKKRLPGVTYRVKDVVGRRGVGIGSAGLQSFNLLLEGRTQALENDIIIYMVQATTSSPSRVVPDPEIKAFFTHEGHRTVVSQRALQAYADPLLGYADIDGVGQLVAESSPYVADLDWGNINDLGEILELLSYLGQAVAKIHCVADDSCDHTLVPFSTDRAIMKVLSGREDAFVDEMVRFGTEYGGIVRDDHRLFVDAFRNRMIPDLYDDAAAESMPMSPSGRS